MSGAATPTRLGRALSLSEIAAAVGATLAGGHARLEALGVSIDSRTLTAGELFVAVKGPRFDGHDFLAEAAGRGAVAALVHRDAVAPPELPLVRVADTTTALGELGRHARLAYRMPVVAITGSVGKTTSKEMAAALLATRGAVLKTEGNLNNQYGLPLTLLRLAPEHTAAVLELGMSAKGELSALTALAQPDVAVITRIAPVHLEFFGSLEAIAAAKAEILEGLRPGGTAVLNHDDPQLLGVGSGFRGEIVWFGRGRECAVSAENWRGTVFGMRFDLRVGGRVVDVALPLAGAHHVTNFLAAAAAAHHLGIAPEAMAAAAATLAPARHRGEVLRLGEDVTLVDDSYNSSPEAVTAALQALALAPGTRRVAFLGEMLELGPSGPELHRATGAAAAARLDALFAVGTLGAHLLEGARGAGAKAASLVGFPDSEAAAAAVSALVRPGDAVLVKGSRGVRMERVVEALVARFGRREG